jgi:succinate-acetate transporter protein
VKACVLLLPVYGFLLFVACVLHSRALAAIVLALLVVTVLLAEAVAASVPEDDDHRSVQ